MAPLKGRCRTAFRPCRRELDVVRIEADVHLLELPRLRIEVLHLPEAVLLWRQRRGRMRGAERRLVLGQAEPRRHPHPALAVHRRVIGDRRVEPVQLVAPVRRRHRHRLRLARRHFRIEHRNAKLLRRVLQRIDDEEAVVAPVDAVDRAVGVGGRDCACRSSARRARTSPDRPSPTSSARDCARALAAAAAPAARRRRAMRSVQSANISRPRWRPSPVTMLLMPCAVLARLHACVPRVDTRRRTSRAPWGSRASPGCPSDGTRCSWP